MHIVLNQTPHPPYFFIFYFYCPVLLFLLVNTCASLVAGLLFLLPLFSDAVAYQVSLVYLP